MEPDGVVTHPEKGSPQGGSVSSMLANIYLHYALDVWFEEAVKAHCQGAAYLCRYADDFVCAFELEADAERFYSVLGNRLAKFGLEVAAEKTNLIRFSPVNWKASGAFAFLGFEFRWGLGRRRKPVIKRRTDRKKYRAALANLQGWCRKNCRFAEDRLESARSISCTIRPITSFIRKFFNRFMVTFACHCRSPVVIEKRVGPRPVAWPHHSFPDCLNRLFAEVPVYTFMSFRHTCLSCFRGRWWWHNNLIAWLPTFRCGDAIFIRSLQGSHQPHKLIN